MPTAPDCDWLDLYRRATQREALLVALARRSATSGRREKLRTLCELAVETRARLRRGAAPEPDWAERGRRRAGALARARWIDFVEALERDVDRDIPRVERLERAAAPGEAAGLARATALLVAMRSFAQLELRGRRAESTRPARALLDAAATPVAVAAG